MIRRLLVLVACGTVSVCALAAELPACSPGQLPYSMFGSHPGTTPAQACQAFATSYSDQGFPNTASVNGLFCTVNFEDGDVAAGAIDQVCASEEQKLSSAYIAKIIAAFMGMWALGFAMGKSVAWMRALGSVG